MQHLSGYSNSSRNWLGPLFKPRRQTCKWLPTRESESSREAFQRRQNRGPTDVSTMLCLMYSSCRSRNFLKVAWFFLPCYFFFLPFLSRTRNYSFRAGNIDPWNRPSPIIDVRQLSRSFFFSIYLLFSLRRLSLKHLLVMPASYY